MPGVPVLSALQPFSEKPVLHRAEWVVPVSSPPVSGGAVLAVGARVLAVGAFSQLKNELPSGAAVADHGRAALIPALVNAHTHLELSALKGLVEPRSAGYPAWLEAVFSLRAKLGENEPGEGFRRGLRELRDSGTALCGDVTNGGFPAENASEKGFPERRVFFELLGFDRKSIAAALPFPMDLDAEYAPFALAPHAPYSVSAEVIRQTKAWTEARGLPFSIHAAEHPEEVEFLRSGTGFCRRLLESLGKWDPGWSPPGKSPAQYLESLGVLDSRTLLVHAVHMNESDWEIAAKRGCSVCFCPRSNRVVGVGAPDIEKALSLGIPASLGTDSLASNADLDLFREAAFVLDSYPALRPEAVLETITRNPAAALGRKGECGSIEPGAAANFLAVSLDPGVGGRRLFEALIHSGKQGAWKWVIPAQS